VQRLAMAPEPPSLQMSRAPTGQQQDTCVGLLHLRKVVAEASHGCFVLEHLVAILPRRHVLLSCARLTPPETALSPVKRLVPDVTQMLEDGLVVWILPARRHVEFHDATSSQSPIAQRSSTRVCANCDT